MRHLETYGTIISKAEADKIFSFTRSVWDAYTAHLSQPEGWRIRPLPDNAGTLVTAFDPNTGRVLSIQPRYRNETDTLDTLIVGSHYPLGRMPSFPPPLKEIERAIQIDLGPHYSVSATYSKSSSLEAVDLKVARVGGTIVQDQGVAEKKEDEAVAQASEEAVAKPGGHVEGSGLLTSHDDLCGQYEYIEPHPLEHLCHREYGSKARPPETPTASVVPPPTPRNENLNLTIKWGFGLIILGMIVTVASVISGRMEADWSRIGTDPSYAETVFGGTVRFLVAHGLLFMIGGGLLWRGCRQTRN